jgi:DedD protein
MNDHNLDDLIIDTPNQKSGKAKGLLTILALFIVVLIVAIILTKIILKDPENQHPVLEENETEMISPELTLQDAVDDEEQDGQVLSEMIKSEMEAPKENTPVEEKVEKVAEETVVIEEKPTEHKAPQTHTVSPKPKTATADTAPKNIEIPTQKEIVKIPKDTTKKAAPVTKPQPKQTPVTSSATTEQYFIQVGSFSKTPTRDSRLISALRKQRFHYKVMRINNMHKVMVGPYRSRAEADRAIVRVKDLINKSAFVVKK